MKDQDLSYKKMEHSINKHEVECRVSAKWFFGAFCRQILIILFSAIFIVQFYNIILQLVKPEKTTTNIYEKDLEGAPVVFIICPKPGFNETLLYELGYGSSYEYFYGLSRFNDSVYGWSGHTENGSTISGARDLYEKVALYPKPEDLLKK